MFEALVEKISALVLLRKEIELGTRTHNTNLFEQCLSLLLKEGFISGGLAAG